MGDLEKNLENNLDRIREGKVRKKLASKSKANRNSEAPVDTHRTSMDGVSNGVSQQREIKQQQAKKKFNKSIRVAVAGCATVAVLVSSCTEQVIVDKTPTYEAARPVATSTVNTEESKPTEVSQEVTKTLAPEATEIPRYNVEASGGAFSAAQEKLNDSDSAKEQKTRIQDWLHYWINFEDRPFANDSEELHWKYVYDDPEDPNEVLVMLQALGDYNGRTFSTPIALGDFIPKPPTIQGEYIGESFGPLELTAGEDGLVLSVDNKVPVRRDSSGQIVERLDMIERVWVKVEKYPIDMEKFRNFPKSYEYLLAHTDEFIQAPDPLTDRAAFDRWFNEELVPALGPVDEREVNLVDGPSYQGRDFRVSVIDSYKTLEPTAFFYFWDGDVLRPVVVENCGDQESRFVVTIATVLFDDGFKGFGEIQRMSEGHELMTIAVFTALLEPDAPQGFINPPGFVFVEKMLEAGFDGKFDDNRIIFGAGFIRTWDK